VKEGERDTRNENSPAPVRSRAGAPLIDKKAGAKAAAVRLELTSTAVKNMLEKKASEAAKARSPHINMPPRPPLAQAAPAPAPAVAAPPLAVEPAVEPPPADEEEAASSPTAAESTTKRSSPPAEAAPAKKAKTPKKKKKKGGEYVGLRVAKYFEGGDGLELFYGEVDRYDESSKFWHITYDDDDQEEMDKAGLKEALKLYEENKKDDPAKS
jgi:type IV secretory pathway VirB10-like protein